MIDLVEAYSGEYLERVKELFRAYADSLDYDLCFQNFEDELKNLPGDYRPPEGRLLLAMYKGENAGCVALRKLGDDICEMKRLYVRPDLRGIGIGRTLAQTVLKESRRIGYKRMQLDTLSSMKLGFSPIPPYYDNPIPGAVFLELVLD
jgi:putative acetyltransferase